MMRHRWPLLLCLMTACASGTSSPAPTPRLPSISAAELRRDLMVFASDSFAGRETGTPSITRATRFLVDRVMALGMEPAGDSLYLQRVPLVREVLTAGTRLVVTQGQSVNTLAVGSDVAPWVNLGSGVPSPRRNAEGDIYFAGYGMNTLGRDDFSGLTEPGKIIVIVHGAPASVSDPATRQLLESQAEYWQRVQRALQYRPSAVIVLTSASARELFNLFLPGLLRTVVAAPGDQTTADAERPLPMLVTGLARPASPLLPANWPSDDSPQLLAGRRFSGHLEVRLEPFTAYNVVAIARGTDPRWNKTYVAFGAHYDHIGMQPEMSPDSIANGADDDGSGSVTMLAIAKSMMAARPRRSALFVWHVGEEKGLLGSAYFTDHPTVPLDSIVAQLNADMIGRNGGPTMQFDSRVSGAANANKLYVVGPNAAPNRQSRTLGAILDSVNARQTTPMDLDHEWDSPTHPENVYQRSDHYSYAKKGIPILFFTTGLHEDYHKVSDEPLRIDYAKMARVGGLLLDLGTTLGNREARPR